MDIYLHYEALTSGCFFGNSNTMSTVIDGSPSEYYQAIHEIWVYMIMDDGKRWTQSHWDLFKNQKQVRKKCRYLAKFLMDRNLGKISCRLWCHLLLYVMLHKQSKTSRMELGVEQPIIYAGPRYIYHRRLSSLKKVTIPLNPVTIPFEYPSMIINNNNNNGCNSDSSGGISISDKDELVNSWKAIYNSIVRGMLALDYCCQHPELVHCQ